MLEDDLRGVDAIGATQIINPGPLRRGAYAYAEINGDTCSVEIRSAGPT